MMSETINMYHVFQTKMVSYLDEIFSDFGAVEHGIEGGDFVDSHGRHVQHLSDLVHGRQGEPATGLSLGQVKHGNNASLSVVLRISVNNQLGLYKT